MHNRLTEIDASRPARGRLQVLLATVTLGLAALVVVKPATAGSHEAVVEGVVFDDADGNGERNLDERGVRGVTVSDGRTSVASDRQGRYRLVLDPERRLTDVVFVSVPTGFEVAPDEFKTPRFYRTLGELRDGDERVQDFALVRKPESANPNHSFVNLADVHVQAGTANNRERFTDQLAQVNELPGDPAFIQVSGDLTNRATDAEFLDYKAATATSRLAVWPAVGNHEYAPGPDYRTRIDNYRRHLGPEWYSFGYGRRHFVVLENNSAGFGDPDQLDWLADDLARHARDKEVVVLVHKPLNTPQTPSGARPYIDLLDRYDTVLVLMGHTHVNDVDLDTIPGASHVVTNSSSYTIDQTPNGFRQVRFQGGAEQHPFKMYDVDRSLTVVNPGPGSEIEQGAVAIQANAYDTSRQVQRAHYRIDGGRWRALKQGSAFTWAATWHTRGASLGQHILDVRVIDDTDQAWETRSTFSLVEPGSLARPAPRSDWPMFHGDQRHTGAATDEVAPDLRLAWAYQTSGTILTSSPAVVDGTAYVGSRDEDGVAHNAVHAVDVATGSRRWRFQTEAQVQASPAVADGTVFASTVRGTLHALDAQTGVPRWDFRVGQSDDGVHRAWMYYSPTVADGVVYQAYSTGAGGFLAAFDAGSGQQLWNSRLAGSWISESSPVVADGQVYVGGDGGWLVSLDAASGTERWRTRPAGGWMHSMPAIADGRLYMGYGGGLLVALDADTGAELWRYQSPDPSYIPGNTTGSSPAVVDGTVYMGFPDGNVAAFDAVTGGRRWSHRTQGGIISSPAVSGGTVYIGSNDGRLYGLDRASGEQRWSYDIGTWVASSPAISGNSLVVGAFDGNLYAFTGRD